MDRCAIAREVASKIKGMSLSRSHVQILMVSESNADMVKALLFAGECDRPLLVPVPIVDGIALPCHVEDLDTSQWIISEYIYPHLIDHVQNNEFQKQLLSNFVVFSLPQVQAPAGMLKNDLMTELTFPADAWWGDVLVVKLYDEMVTDVRVEDVALIKQLLVWFVVSFYNQALDSDSGLS